MFGTGLGRILLGVGIFLLGALALLLLDPYVYGDIVTVISWVVMIIGTGVFLFGLIQQFVATYTSDDPALARPVTAGSVPGVGVAGGSPKPFDANLYVRDVLSAARAHAEQVKETAKSGKPGLGLGKLLTGIAVFLAGFLGMILLDPYIYGDIVVVITWAVMLVGLILFLYGIIQRAIVSFDETATAPAVVRPNRSTELDTYMVRSMMAMASADGHLDEREVTTISRAYEAITGMPLPAARVREMATAMGNRDVSIYDELGKIEGRMSPATKAMIMKATYLVLIADNDAAEAEQNRIADIAQALKLPYERAIAALREVHESPVTRVTGRA
jgi:uncharacterized tellurite resistance protein B-like protein